jgi:hypothetical protein
MLTGAGENFEAEVKTFSLLFVYSVETLSLKKYSPH